MVGHRAGTGGDVTARWMISILCLHLIGGMQREVGLATHQTDQAFPARNRTDVPVRSRESSELPQRERERERASPFTYIPFRMVITRGNRDRRSVTQGPGDGSPHRGAGEDEVPVEGAGRAPGGAEEEREPGGEGGGIIEPPPVDGLNAPGIERLIATIIAQAMAHGGATGGGTGGGPGGPQGGNRPDDIEGLNYNEVDKALIVCGVGDPAMRDIIRVAEAFETLESFCLLEDDEAVDAWLKRASQKPAPNQLSLGEVQIYNLKGLAYWVRDRMARGLPLTADEFDVDAMREAIEMRRLEKKRNKEEDIKEPGKCETGTGWDEWKESFINYCSQKRSAAGGPLSYVIREDVNPRTYVFRDEQERKLHQYPHRGNVYMTDNRRVAQLLKASTLTTDAYVTRDYERTESLASTGGSL